MPKTTKLKIDNNYYNIHLNENGYIIENYILEKKEYSIYNEIIYAIYKNLKCEVVTINKTYIKLIYKGQSYSKVLDKFKKEGDIYTKEIKFEDCSRVFARRRAVRNYPFDVQIEYEFNTIEELHLYL